MRRNLIILAIALLAIVPFVAIPLAAAGIITLHIGQITAWSIGMLGMAAEAMYLRDPSSHKLVTSGTVASGEVLQLADGRAAYMEGLQAAASGDTVSLRTCGVVKLVCASGVTFSKGDAVHWDVSANTAITKASADAGDFYLGRAHAAKASGSLVVEVDLNALSDSEARGEGKLYSAVAAAAAVTASSTETSFDKSIAVPANKLKVGDIIRVRAQVIATATNSTDTLTLKLKIGGVTVVTTGAVDVANNDIGYIECDIVVRTIGAGGTIVAAGVQALGVPGTVTAKPFLLASSSLDTTAAATIEVTAQWSTTNAGNSCRLDVLNVERLTERVVL